MENKMNDGTSFHQSDSPILCANGCGFWGTAATMNLCSKCYRDHRLKEEQTASAIAAVEKSLSPPSAAVVVTEKLVPAVTEPVGTSSEAEVAAPDAQPPAKPKNRCESCNKKVGVMGFKCKCGSTFCGIHRMAEAHGCTFDFKGAGRNAIAKANPIVKAEKVQRF